MKQVAPLVDKDSCTSEEDKKLARNTVEKRTISSTDSMFAYQSEQTEIIFKPYGWMEGVTREDNSIGN